MEKKQTQIQNRQPGNRWKARFSRRIIGKKSRQGLTLVELAIVILVLGVIMGIVYSSLDFGITDDARKLQVQSSSKQLQIHWERYEFDYPPLEEGQPLTILSESSPEHEGWRPIDSDLVMDPWKKPYFICSDDTGKRQICSYGSDGQPGGEGTAADFYLTDKSSWPAWLSGK